MTNYPNIEFLSVIVQYGDIYMKILECKKVSPDCVSSVTNQCSFGIGLARSGCGDIWLRLEGGVPNWGRGTNSVSGSGV